MRSHFGRSLGLCGAVLFLASATPAQECWIERQEEPGTSTAERFGSAMSIEGSVAVVASDTDHTAMVYRYDGARWQEEQELAPVTDPLLPGRTSFVALSGDAIAIGAAGDDGWIGAVFVYRYDGSGWREEAKLTPSDGRTSDLFGFSVAMDADVLLVGAVGVDDFTGAAYVFRFDGAVWQEEQKLPADLGQTQFGIALDVGGDRAVVGTDTGEVAVAYTYTAGAWVVEQAITRSEGRVGRFGRSVALHGPRLLVGALADDTHVLGGGAVHSFLLTGDLWVEEQKLFPPESVAFGGFGASLALGDTTALIGSFADRGYLFERDSQRWNEVRTLTGSDSSSDDSFGISVAFDAGVALLGAPSHDHVLKNTGAAYFFTEAEFTLRAEPDVVHAGEQLEFLVREGAIARRAMLLLVDFDGMPMLQTVAIGTFDDLREWTVRATVPPGLAGSELSFQALGFDACDSLRASERSLVRFE